MKILITGITGFVGKHVAIRALKEGYRVSAIIRNPAARSELERMNVSCFIDRGVFADMLDYFDTENFVGVVHCASRFQTEHKAEDIGDLIDSNVHFPTKLLECSAEAGVKWFINTGTFWQHYDNRDYSPVNLYAATKQAFESIAEYYLETCGINFITLKLTDTYGPNDTRPKIFNLWKRIAGTGETIEMTGGQQWIDIVHVSDVAGAYLRAMELLQNDDARALSGQSFAVSSGHPILLRELAKIYGKLTGRRLNIEWGKRPYRHREVMVPWNKGKSLPGWHPKVSLEEGITSLFHSENQ